MNRQLVNLASKVAVVSWPASVAGEYPYRACSPLQCGNPAWWVVGCHGDTVESATSSRLWFGSDTKTRTPCTNRVKDSLKVYKKPVFRACTYNWTFFQKADRRFRLSMGSETDVVTGWVPTVPFTRALAVYPSLLFVFGVTVNQGNPR